MEIAFLGAGILIGGALVWLFVQGRGQSERIRAETRLEETLKADQRMTETFRTVAADALAASNQGFLALANQTFEVATTQVRGDLAPLKEALSKYETNVNEIEKSRREAYGSLREQISGLLLTNQQVQKETSNLVGALRTPHIRGRWGELTLQRVAELAGMVANCDFVEQEFVDGDNGRLRPDMMVHLPAGREIIVDAKVPLDAYLTAIEGDEEHYALAMTNHVRQIRTHMNALAAKAYWDQFGQAAEFVVMFIPGESFLAPAAQQDPTLIEEALAKRVVIATPTTLVALLKAIAYGWRQEQLAESAQEISDLGKQLYDRIAVFTNHLGGVGRGLSRTVVAYNAAVGSLDSRVLPSVRRFRDLGAGSTEEITTLAPVMVDARDLPAPAEGDSPNLEALHTATTPEALHPLNAKLTSCPTTTPIVPATPGASSTPPQTINPHPQLPTPRRLAKTPTHNKNTNNNHSIKRRSRPPNPDTLDAAAHTSNEAGGLDHPRRPLLPSTPR